MASNCNQGNLNKRICPEGKRYAEKMLAGSPKVAIMACEGGCIKGEVARVAANILAYRLERETTARICLGDAVTGDSGFIDLVKQSPKTVVIEGCFLHCGTTIMRKRISNFDPVIIEGIKLYSFDRDKYFEIFDMPREEIEEYARKVAKYIQQTVFKGEKVDELKLNTNCCDS